VESNVPDTPAAPRRRIPPVVWALLAATLPHLWSLRLEFAADDYNVIVDAPRIVGLARTTPPPDFAPDFAPFLPPPLPVESHVAAAQESYLFRPVASAWWLGLTKAGGGRADRTIFRLATLLLHAATVALLYLLLRRFLPDVAAAAVAAWFGFAPGAHQAYTWIAAAGDLLATTLVLGGLLLLVAAARRDGATGVLGTLAGGLCVGLSIGAKESAAVLIPVAAFAYVALGRPSPKRFSVGAFGVIVAVAAMLFGRLLLLGDWRPRYPTERPFTLDVVLRLPEVLGALFATWNQSPALADRAPLVARIAESFGGADPAAGRRIAAYVAAACAAPALVGILFGGFRRFAAALGCALAAAVALLPVAWMQFDHPDTFLASRSCYAGAAALAATLGCAVAAFARRGPVAVVVALLPLFVLAADGEIHAARVELTAAAEIRARLDAVRAEVDRRPSGTRVVVTDDEPEIPQSAISLVGPGYAYAFSRPFTDRPRPVHYVSRRDPESDLRLLRVDTRPIVFAAFKKGVFAAEAEAHPAGDAAPTFVVDPTRPGVFVPTAPSPARFVAALRGRGRATGGELRVRWSFVAANDPSRTVEDLRGAVAVGDDWWSVAPEARALEPLLLRSVAFEGLTLDAPPVPERALPWTPIVEGVGATTQGRLVAGELPSFAFRPPFPAARHRIVFEFDLDGIAPRLVYTPAPESLRTEADGRVRFTASPADAVDADPMFDEFGRFEKLRTLWDRVVQIRGVARLPIRYRVESSGADAVLSRSSSATFLLVGELK
jgi:hypothetical protein